MTPDPERFVLDQDENPHPQLLRLALAARHRSELSDSNMAAKAYFLGVLHACSAATGCSDDEVAAWLDAHDEPALLDASAVPLEVIDAAVRSRRVAMAGRGDVALYRHWQGVLETLCAWLGAKPEQVDALIARLDLGPVIVPIEGAPVRIR